MFPSRFSKVIKLYKQLYITRNQTFQDDQVTLTSKKKIKHISFRLFQTFLNNLMSKDSLTRLRNEFRLNKNESDPTKIQEVRINVYFHVFMLRK